MQRTEETRREYLENLREDLIMATLFLSPFVFVLFLAVR